MPKNKLLITGANGFLGRKVLESFNSSQVQALYRKGSSHIPDYESAFVDKFDSETDFSHALTDVISVVHLAAIIPTKNTPDDEVWRVNYLATKRLVEQCIAAKVEKFVFVSTIGVHGHLGPKTNVNENSQIQANNIYAKSKLKAEEALKELTTNSEMDFVILRPTLIYGDSAKGSFNALKSIIRKLPIIPFGAIDSSRSMVSVSNMVDVIHLCLNSSSANNQVFVVSDPMPYSFEQIVDAISKNSGSRVFNVSVPVGVLRYFIGLLGKEHLIDQIALDYTVDVSKIRQTLDWAPKFDLYSELPPSE